MTTTVKDLAEATARARGFGMSPDEFREFNKDLNKDTQEHSRSPVDQFETLGAELGHLVSTKQAVYGDAISSTAELLRVLYPSGIRPYQYRDIHIVIRVLDKLSRIANRNAGELDKMAESPWQDIAGYGLLGQRSDELAKE
jgi:hypothetical protein